jgi:putative tributyrin esterase
MARRLPLLISLLACWLIFPLALFAEPLPVKTIEFGSDSVGRKMKYNIVLPAGYQQGQQRYPVLYLLHGLTSNYTAWARMRVPEYARQYELIVVMPDVGNSWYVNWAKSEAGQKNAWEDFVVGDLIGHVDATFRTIARREGRAINGLSMGGYGGLVLGLRHPELFCSIGSHSGALAYARMYGERLQSGKEVQRPTRTPSATPDPRIGIEGFSSQIERSPKGQIFTTVEECAAHDPFQLILLVPRDKLPHIILDCGTEDRLIEGAQEFARLLMEHKIPFVYGQSGGGHSPPYWAREVGVSMAVQYAVMQRLLKDVQTKEAKTSPPKTK